MRIWMTTCIALLLRVVSKHLASPFSTAQILPHSRGYTSLSFIGDRNDLQDRSRPTIMSGSAKNQGAGSQKLPDSNNEEIEEPSQLVKGWDTPEITAEDEDPLFDEYCSVLDDFGCEAYEDLAKNIDEKVYRWIRVEAKEDESLADIHSKEDALRKIEEVKSHQGQFGPSQLYPRKWQSQQKKHSSAVNGDTQKAVAAFSVLQFNALAEGLSSGPDVRTPFPIKKKREGSDKVKPKDQGYGGFSQIEFPEICLDFSQRRWRLLEVFLGSTSDDGNDKTATEDTFDILALEEIDRFRGFFAPVLRLFGYEGIFMPKAKSPSVPLGFYSDGCALFWKTSVFELLSEERLQYKVGNQVIILATLKHIASGTPVLVAVTHLKAQKSESSEKIRCIQVEELLGYVQDSVKNQSEALETKNFPVLIMGDFNADPPSEIPFPASSIKRVIHNHEVTSSETKCENPLRFQSAYPIDPPDKDFFTTWKTRGTDTVKRTIDYIFHSDQLTCAELLGAPTTKDVEKGKLPGLQYPSDHLMVAAKFEVKK